MSSILLDNTSPLPTLDNDADKAHSQRMNPRERLITNHNLVLFKGIPYGTVAL